MNKTLHGFWNKVSILVVAFAMVACSDDVSYVQKESPANAYKDYKGAKAAVIGVGEPINKRQMKADAVFSIKGKRSLKDVMNKIAHSYNLAVRWGDGIRNADRRDLMIADLTFDEARNYVEDVFDIQIIREGERRLLVLPSVDEVRIEKFSPGANLSLSQVIRGLAEQCEYNLVITENRDSLATTVVTTSLKDVTCQDAFDALLVPHGMSLVKKGGHYIVGGFPHRQWVLNLHEPKRSSSRSVNYSTSAQGDGDATSSSGAQATVGVSSDRDLWVDLQEDLNGLLDQSCDEFKRSMSSIDMAQAPSVSSEPSSMPTGFPGFEAPIVSSGSGSSPDFECGYIRVNKTVGMVQMQAPEFILEAADEIITRIEDVASRRLYVEARILAITKDRGYGQKGQILGNKTIRGRNFGYGSLPGDLGSTDNEGLVTGSDSQNITDALTKILMSAAAGGTAIYEGNDLEALVNIAESYGTTYQLMNPSMEVMDRQQALLIDGRNEKYFIVNETIDNSGETPILTREVEEKTQFVGIQFAVTAQVADEGEPHTVSVQIPITDIVEFVTVPTGTNSQVPIVTTRVIDQKVRLRDGEIKVIGGLTRTIAVDKESGVPLLRGIPVAGKLFNQENIEYQDAEFIVLLRVRRVY